MKKIGFIAICVLIITLLVSCGNDISKKVLKEGDRITVTGIVEYSEKPSDIGQRYCSVTGDVEFEYTYIDIYDKESKWSSNQFFAKGADTDLLKEYEGEKVTVTGVLETESHGILYITDIEITKGED